MIPETYPGTEVQPLFDLMIDEHGITLLQSEMVEIIKVVNTIERPKLNTQVAEAMEHLISAHNLLAKSSLLANEYTAILIQLNYAKIILTEIK